MTEDPNPNDDWTPTVHFRWVIESDSEGGSRSLQQKWVSKDGRVNWVNVRHEHDPE